MPSKMIICEYCKQGIRKDRLAIHVKAKHVKELAAQFLQDATKPLFNPIQSLMKGHKHIPVYSKADDKALYYFGVVPRYFEDADSFGDYISNEDNMTAHKAFLNEVVETISIQDYYKATGKVLLKPVNPMEELQAQGSAERESERVPTLWEAAFAQGSQTCFAAVHLMSETIKQKDAEIKVLQIHLNKVTEAFKAGGRYNVVDLTKLTT